MRPKVVLAILLMAAGVLAVAVMLSKVFRPQPAVATVPVAITHSNSSPVTLAPKPAVVIAPAPVTITNRATNAIAPQDHEEYVKNRYEELMDLAREDSPAAIQQIMAELKNPDRAIRKAALDALEQANDRSVVPQMQQIADQTDDPDDKQAIQDAIDFINLPSLTEVRQQQKAQNTASGNQPQSQPPHSPHHTQAAPAGSNQ
ncbi:MAG: HEAT repeat domain-containing protein [Verrucomicrobiota bacterium]